MQYINLYSGPEYLMHFRYSSILVQVYVAFMYGLMIPIFWIIALVGIFNMFLVERLTLAYYFRQPPMFDASLNQRAIDLLQRAPFAMFILAYWSFGNRQSFFNEPLIIYDHASSPANTNHKAFDFTSINQTQLILVIILHLIIDEFGYKSKHNFFVKIGLIRGEGSKEINKDINEGLSDYFQAMSGIE